MRETPPPVNLGELFPKSPVFRGGGTLYPRVVVRHPVVGLQHDMRVKDGTKFYDITAILDAERTGGGPELHCFERAP